MNNEPNKKANNEFLNSEEYLKQKDEFPFLVDLTVATWKFLSRTLLSISKVKFGSTLNNIIGVDNFNSKEERKRKETFPFVVDMQDAWKSIFKSLKELPKKSRQNESSATI